LELDEELEAAGVAGPRRGAGSDLFSAGEEKEETGHALSKHEALQAKLKKQIGKLEEENIAVKEWMMAGEAKAKERPENSLLEEPLEFEHASKPAPVITQEVTSFVLFYF
jgi:U3 small nucleolar RNA-associated protein MPP10